jgi:hypothetical protein
MERFTDKALEMIGGWDLRIKELQEKEDIESMFRSAISSELTRRNAAAIRAERLVLQSVRAEVKRLLR